MAGDGGEVLEGDRSEPERAVTKPDWDELIIPPDAYSLHRSAKALEEIAASLARLVEVLEAPRTDLQPLATGAIARQMIHDRPAKRPSPTHQPMPPAPRCKECSAMDGKHSPNCPQGKLDGKRILEGR